MTTRAIGDSMDCPLVRLAQNHQILKQFEQTGKVVIPLTDWIRFFEVLAFMIETDTKKSTEQSWKGT
jgi:hypothetical protein